MEAKYISKGIQVEEAQSLSSSSHQGGRLNQVQVFLSL